MRIFDPLQGPTGMTGLASGFATTAAAQTLGVSSNKNPREQIEERAYVHMATVRNQVLLSLFTDFENFSVFKPDARHENSVNAMFDQVIAWSGALKALREKRA